MHMTWVNNPYFTRVLGNEVSKSGLGLPEKLVARNFLAENGYLD